MSAPRLQLLGVLVGRCGLSHQELLDWECGILRRLAGVEQYRKRKRLANKIYRKTHAEACRIADRNRHQKHRDRDRLTKAAWHKRHPGANARYLAKSRAKRKALAAFQLTQSLVAAVAGNQLGCLVQQP